MADPEIRKRNPDDDEEEAPARLRPLGAGDVAPDSSDRLRPVSSVEGASERLQPIVSTQVQQPDQSLLSSPRSSLMGFRSREDARRRGEDLNAPAGGPTEIPDSGSSGAARVELERLADEKAHPWGSEGNHPGRLGKIGHVLGEIGNVAGDMLIPNQMAAIPGSEMNREVRKREAEGELRTAEAGERAGAEAKSKEELEAAQKTEAEAKAKNLGEKDSEALAKLGQMRDADGNIVPDPTSPAYQRNQIAMDSVKHLQDLRDAQRELAEARTEVEQAKNDPNSPAFKAAQQRLAMASEAHRIAAQNLGLHQEQFQNKLQEQQLLKPSGQAQSRGSAAQAVLDLIPDLKTLVNKHREDMGPIMGRLNRGEIAIGNVDPEIARLYSAMKSFYALQPAVHGFRNAEFVKDFEHALGTLERNPDAFIAGMEGLKPTLDSVAKEGKTFHKRIVEGGGASAQFKVPDGAPEAPKEDNKILKVDGKPVARSKGGQWGPL